MQSIDYSKISITAKLVAFFRQFSDIPFAKDVADYVNAEGALQEISSNMQSEDLTESQQEKMREDSKVYSPLLESRYKSIVAVIHKTGVKQVLELASGFSLRGLSMSQDPEISYVESDLPGVNEEKAKLIATIRSKYRLNDTGNHQIVTANALEQSDLDAATVGLKRDQPLLVVNEGLIPYLSVEERDLLASNVLYLLGQFNGGAWITPDFTTKQLSDNVSQHRLQIRKAILGATDRQLHDAAFDSEQAIDDFIESHGFTGTCTYQKVVVPRLVTPERMGISDQVMEGLNAHMRIWHLRPQ